MEALLFNNWLKSLSGSYGGVHEHERNIFPIACRLHLNRRCTFRITFIRLTHRDSLRKSVMTRKPRWLEKKYPRYLSLISRVANGKPQQEPQYAPSLTFLTRMSHSNCWTIGYPSERRGQYQQVPDDTWQSHFCTRSSRAK